MKTTWNHSVTAVLGAGTLGVLLGLIAKYLDTVSVDGSLCTVVLHWFADLFTRMGIWVLIAVLLAAFSSTPQRAAAKVFVFFAGMLVAYYVYSMQLFGFFPTRYFVFWGVLALASPLCAVLVWFGKHHAKLGWFLPALPIGLLLTFAVSAGWGYFDVSRPAELVMAVLLCAVFYKSPKQLACVLLLSAAATTVINQLILHGMWIILSQIVSLL